MVFVKFFFSFFVEPLAFPCIYPFLVFLKFSQPTQYPFPVFSFNQVARSQERELTTSGTMVRAASSAKVQCQIITGSEGFSLSDLGRVSVSPVLPNTDVHVLAWMSLTERQKFSWKLIPSSSSCRRRFVSRTKELILEERTATNKPRRNRKEDIRKEGKEEREKETRRHSRIVLNAETRG